MYDDSEQFDLGRYKWLIPIVVIILVAAFFLVQCSTNNLQGYVDSSSVAETTASASSELDESVQKIADPTYNYVNDALHYSIDVPEAWAKVLGENNEISFIDKRNSVQLRIFSQAYNPQINRVSYDSCQVQAAQSNMELREFKQITTSSYAVSYATKDYWYLEYVYWDYTSILTLRFTIPTQYSNDTTVMQTVKYVNQSLIWNRERAIPEDLQLIYSDMGSFEFGLPVGWTFGSSGGTIIATAPDGTASFTVSVTEATMELSQISQVDTLTYLQQSKPGFNMESYTNNGTILEVRGTYNLNGKPIDLHQYVKVQNGYEYTLIFESENQVTSSLAVTMQNVINSFGYF